MSDEVDFTTVVNQQAIRIAELEREINNYERVVRHLRSSKGEGALNDELYWRNIYLEGKLRRQSAAIDKMQRKGWQPQLIIREVPYPDDKHLWDEPRPESRRREKKRPSVLIGGI